MMEERNELPIHVNRRDLRRIEAAVSPTNKANDAAWVDFGPVKEPSKPGATYIERFEGPLA